MKLSFEKTNGMPAFAGMTGVVKSLSATSNRPPRVGRSLIFLHNGGEVFDA